jgi:hypothetical protein
VAVSRTKPSSTPANSSAAALPAALNSPTARKNSPTPSPPHSRRSPTTPARQRTTLPTTGKRTLVGKLLDLADVIAIWAGFRTHRDL